MAKLVKLIAVNTVILTTAKGAVKVDPKSCFECSEETAEALIEAKAVREPTKEDGDKKAVAVEGENKTPPKKAAAAPAKKQTNAQKRAAAAAAKKAEAEAAAADNDDGDDGDDDDFDGGDVIPVDEHEELEQPA